jgi:outer membrane protein assembly factor BamB
MKTSFFKPFVTGIVSFLLLGTSINLQASGPAFRELHNLKLPFTPSTHWYTHTDDFKFFLCSTKSDMLMLDGTTGKILWQKNFEKEYQNAKFSNQFWNKDANVILVFDEDTKKSVAMKYFIDGATGNLLWKSDKYVSDFGDYELSNGFSSYYDPATNGVLLPTNESVDFVDVRTGKTIWSKAFTLAGKSKDFDSFIMAYYDLVMVITGKESEMYLTTSEGKEVTEIEPYFNKKKYLNDRLHASVIDIPDKNLYVLMQGETNKFYQFLGAGSIPKWKMTFKGYDTKTNELKWVKQYNVTFMLDFITKQPYVRMFYDQGMLFVEHDPNMNSTSGLTVLNPENGEMLWEAHYSTCEAKNSGLAKTLYTPFPTPSPLSANGKTFVIDKKKNVVNCYDSKTGSLIWKSKEFPDAQVIPSLFLSGNVLVMAHGGDAVKFVSIVQDKGPNKYTYEYRNKDKYGLIAYDINTGNIVWSNESIEKSAKDKFDYIAGAEMIDGKLYCATDKNFFILDPKTGNVLNNVPVSKEKMGDAWKMFYFPEKQKLIVNCEDGVVKVDTKAMAVEGTLKTKTIPFYPASEKMLADDLYSDYALFTTGDSEKFKFKEFVSIDLDKMAIRGSEEGDLLFYDIPHFSDGGEMFYKADGGKITFYSVK